MKKAGIIFPDQLFEQVLFSKECYPPGEWQQTWGPLKNSLLAIEANTPPL